MSALQDSTPRGITALGFFWLFGAIMALLAGVTLGWKGTSLDRIWALNPRAYNTLAPFGKTVGIPFLLLAVTLAVASVGWFKRCLWAWRLTVGIVVMQILGDLVNVFLGHNFEDLLGAAIAGALLFYLVRGPMRRAFGFQTQARPKGVRL
jgi:hypothetical protein